MTRQHTESLESRWARAGLLLNCSPSDQSPDLERLLCDTAVGVRDNSRLFPLVVTWLVRHGRLVARHRLQQLILVLPPEQKAVLGLLIESAVAFGAARNLRLVLSSCDPLPIGRPLFSVHRANASLGSVAEQTASQASRKWGIWAPDVSLKDKAVRPILWILRENEDFHSRIVRKGDLRSSILEALKWDLNGHARSESELARLVGATRASVRRSLAALEEEGAVAVGREGKRENGIELRIAA